QVLIPGREAPAVDPRRARCRAVVLQLAESLQVLFGIAGHVAVDLPEHLEGAYLTRVERHLARVWIKVPGDVLPALVPRQLRVGVRLLQSLRQVVVEPAVGPAIPRRLGG